MHTGLRIRKGFTGEWQAWTHPQIGPPEIPQIKDPKKETNIRESIKDLGGLLLFGAFCVLVISIRAQLGAPMAVGIFSGLILTLTGCFCIWGRGDTAVAIKGFTLGISAVFVLVFSANNVINYGNWLSSRCKYPGCWEKGTEPVVYQVYGSPMGRSVTVYYCTNHVKLAPSSITVSVPSR